MVGVTEQHPLILNPSPIKSVLLGGQEVVQVKGKKKKGGIKVNAKLDLAIITLEDGTSYKLKSYVDGFVIEINENFNKQRPLDRGYLAIIQGRII